VDNLGIVLLIGTALWVVLLFVIEARAIATGRPTISARVRSIGRGATIVIVISMFVLGYLSAHFFDNFISPCY
jgi:cytochrome b561